MSAAASSFVRPPWASPAGVWSVLVDGPAEEPLTVAEAKLRAGLDWLAGDPRDAMIEDFIRTARATVEHDTGLALITQTRDVYVDGSVAGVVPLPSQTQPTQTITALAPTPSGPIRMPWGYVPGARATLDAAAGAAYRVVAGWPTAAALRQEAPTLYHAVALLAAHYATTGRDLVGETVGQRALTPLGYEEAVAPHRLVWVI